MVLATTILFGVGPSLLWLWLVHRHDDHEREPWLLVLSALAAGAAVTACVLWTQPMLATWFGVTDPAVDAFLVTALGEESWKWLALVPFLLHREVDEPLDGAVYGAAVGLGFAAVENVLYALATGDGTVLLPRAFTSTLVHAACTGCLGFCCALVKLARLGRAGAAVWLVLGLPLAVALHGTYDLYLIREPAHTTISLLVVLPAALVLFALKVRWARARSPRYHP